MKQAPPMEQDTIVYTQKIHLYFEKQLLFLYLKLVARGVLDVNDALDIVSDSMQVAGEPLDKIMEARKLLETIFTPVEEARRR